MRRVCQENKIDTTLLEDLCEKIHGYRGMARVNGINEDIMDCIDSFIRREDATDCEDE